MSSRNVDAYLAARPGANRRDVERIHEKFALFDRDGSGAITVDEMEKALANLGETVNKFQLQQMLEEADKDKSGTVDFQEFADLVSKSRDSKDAGMAGAMHSAQISMTLKQKKTYTGWCNVHLSKRNLRIMDLFKDLRDGVLMINLIEIISGGRWKAPPRYNKKPKLRVQMLENLNFALQAIQSEGIKLVNIGSDDLNEGNERITLGLIWMLILYYQIQANLQDSQSSAKNALLEWVRENIKDYNLPVNNFHSSFQDGRVLCALVHRQLPDSFDWSEIDPENKLSNVERAFKLAARELDIPELMDAEDVVEHPDENSIMTYVSYLQASFLNGEKRKNQPPPPPKTIKIEFADPAAQKTVLVGTTNQAAFTVVTDPPGESATAVNLKAVAVDGNNREVLLEVRDSSAPSTMTLVSNYTVPGTYNVQFSWTEGNVESGPFPVEVHAAGVSAGKTTASGPGLERPVALERTQFTIHTKDALGNPHVQPGVEGELEVLIYGDEDPTPVRSQLVNNQDGTVTASYIPLSVGKHTVSVSHRNKPIAGSAFEPVVTAPEKADAGKSSFSLAGGPEAVAGVPYEITIQARDGLGKERTVGGEKFDVAIGGTAGTVEDKGNGTYKACVVPCEAGTASVTVQLDGKDVRGSPAQLRVVPGSASELTSLVRLSSSGAPSASRGKAVEMFRVRAVDVCGNRLTKGGDSFVVKTLRNGREPVDAQVRDNGDGTYDVSYAELPPADYTMDVYLEMAEGAFNERQRHFQRARLAVGDQTTTSTSGSETQTTEPARIKGRTLDEILDTPPTLTKVAPPPEPNVPPLPANPKVCATCNEAVRGPCLEAVNRKWHQDCLVCVVCKTNLVGAGFKEVKGWPLCIPDYFQIYAPRCRACGLPIKGKYITTEGITFHPDCYTCDACEQPLRPESKVAIRSMHKFCGDCMTTLLTEVVKTTTTTTTATTTVRNIEAALATMAQAGAAGSGKVLLPLKEGHFELDVAPVGAPEFTTADGAGMRRATAGEPAVFKVAVKDAHGMLAGHGGAAIVSKVTNGPAEVPSRVEDHGDGTYTVTYTPTKAEPHNVDVTMSGKAIQGAPYTVTVDPGATDAATSQLSGAGLTNAVANQPAAIQLQARDVCGNNKKTGGDPFKLELVDQGSGQRVPGTVRDNGDGTYALSYVAPAGGTYSLEATLEGKPVGGGPFVTKVEAVSDAGSCSASGPGLTNATVGSPAEFTVEFKDHTGMAVDKESDVANLQIKVAGPSGDTVPTQTTYLGNGQTKVTYTPKEIGSNAIGIQLNGAPIGAKSPYSVATVVPGAAHAPSCRVSGPGLVQATANKDAKINIDAYDAFGNRRTGGGDPFVVSLEQRDGSKIAGKVADRGDGTYEAVYTPTLGGPGKLSVTLNGQEVGGGPFTTQVTAVSDHGQCSADGEGVRRAVVGERTTFQIHLKDHTGAKVDNPDDVAALEVTLRGPEPGSVVRGQVDQQTLEASFVAPAVGEAELVVHLHGEPIGAAKRDPFSKVQVVPGEVEPGTCVAHGEGLTRAYAHIPAKFTIQARDRLGNNRTEGGEVFEISDGSASFAAEVTDNKDGTYAVKYTKREVGPMTMAVRCRGKDIQGSPFRVDVRDTEEYVERMEALVQKVQEEQVACPKCNHKFSITEMLGLGWLMKKVAGI